MPLDLGRKRCGILCELPLGVHGRLRAGGLATREKHSTRIRIARVHSRAAALLATRVLATLATRTTVLATACTTLATSATATLLATASAATATAAVLHTLNLVERIESPAHARRVYQIRRQGLALKRRRTAESRAAPVLAFVHHFILPAL